MHKRFDSNNGETSENKLDTRRRFDTPPKKVPQSGLLFRVTCTIAVLLVMLILVFAVSLTATGYHHYLQNESSSQAIILPKFDRRDFKEIVLKNNIQAVLISDPNAKTASAAMSVGVGSGSNPQKLPGLAHLLEHMLFLGSTKFQDHTRMGKLVNIGGGYTNAYTSDTETNYYFISGPSEFQECLEIFSWFFRDPLLDPEDIGKEVQNVNSEHRKNMNNDDWRAMNLIRHMADNGSSYSSFNTGNEDTLWNIPLRNGVNMSDALRNFYDQYYSSEIMKLSIMSSLPIEEMEELAIQMFSEVSEDRTKNPE